MIELLNSLTKKLSEEANNIAEFITSGNKYKSTIFKNSYKFNSLETRPSQIRGKAGVYVFIFEQPISFDNDEVRKWNSITGAGFKNYESKEFNKGDCLYVGSGDSIFSRMMAHFSPDGESTGLHLSNPKRSKALNCVIVYSFPLKDEYQPYASIIAREVEKKLHNILSPAAGSSRV